MKKAKIQEFMKLGYIVKVQGKPFIRYEGLLILAEERQLISIETQQIELDRKEQFAQFKATAKIPLLIDGKHQFNQLGKLICKTFTSYGDGSPKNINRGVISSFIRVAETRAKARALRDLCGIGMCSVEELASNQQEPGYNPRKDKDFVHFCQSYGGVEKLREYMVKSGYPDIDLLPKKRINNLMQAVLDGGIIIDMQANR